MIYLHIFFTAWFFLTSCFTPGPAPLKKRKLIWSEEFNYTGRPHQKDWVFESGYLRNQELQYYTSRPENARVENGNLVIEARMDSLKENGKILPITRPALLPRANTSGSTAALRYGPKYHRH